MIQGKREDMEEALELIIKGLSYQHKKADEMKMMLNMMKISLQIKLADQKMRQPVSIDFKVFTKYQMSNE